MATRALIIYLGAYLLASYSVFGIMTWNAGHDDADQTLDDYLEFGEKYPALGFVLVIGLASLAGIPPLAGFIGKLLLFMAAWKAGLTTLLYIAVIGVAASIFYYFGWIQEATFRFWKAKDPTAENQEELQTAPSTIISSGLLWTLILLTAATVILGFYRNSSPSSKILLKLVRLHNFVYNKPTSKLGLKPSCFWRHDITSIRNRNQLIHRHFM